MQINKQAKQSFFFIIWADQNFCSPQAKTKMTSPPRTFQYKLLYILIYVVQHTMSNSTFYNNILTTITNILQQY